ncbi:DUF4349 domain-containing protein [Demequina sp. NBRC 110052]|uniref:DUF4349 domain-containing protein n=1 Tax=Demequina sp. NBRC 110052 TaxID=1570341 RepID=UPI0013562F81|nr:DUF4349 domain-containing protein [Demequina sp. NBRC 110052]
MSAIMGGAGRRGRRAGFIVGLMAIAGMLAACSSSGSDASASYDDGYASGGDVGAYEESADDGGTAPSAQDRAVIVTGEMYMTVEDPVATADQVATIVQSAGGRVDGRSETAPDEYYGGAAALTLRIPADELDDVLERVRALGTVDELRTESSDVTTQVTDLESRISTLRASTKRIEGLLTEAKDIGDIIALENELSSRQAELESLEARQRGLDDQVSMSTIYLSLTTEPVVIVDDSPDSFWDGLVSGWNALVAFVSGALVVIGVVLPWLALAGILAFGTMLVVRAKQGRARRSAAPQVETTGQAAQESEPSQS